MSISPEHCDQPPMLQESVRRHQSMMPCLQNEAQKYGIQKRGIKLNKDIDLLLDKLAPLPQMIIRHLSRPRYQLATEPQQNKQMGRRTEVKKSSTSSCDILRRLRVFAEPVSNEANIRIVCKRGWVLMFSFFGLFFCVLNGFLVVVRRNRIFVYLTTRVLNEFVFYIRPINYQISSFDSSTNGSFWRKCCRVCERGTEKITYISIVVVFWEIYFELNGVLILVLYFFSSYDLAKEYRFINNRTLAT